MRGIIGYWRGTVVRYISNINKLIFTTNKIFVVHPKTWLVLRELASLTADYSHNQLQKKIKSRGAIVGSGLKWRGRYAFQIPQMLETIMMVTFLKGSEGGLNLNYGLNIIQ